MTYYMEGLLQLEDWKIFFKPTLLASSNPCASYATIVVYNYVSSKHHKYLYYMHRHLDSVVNYDMWFLIMIAMTFTHSGYFLGQIYC